MKKKEKIQEEIRGLLTNFLSLVQIEADFSIEELAEEEKSFKIIIEPKSSSGLLIGARGDTLKAIQSFLSMSLKQKTGDWIRISLDVSGYMNRQEERLQQLAKQTLERVKSTGQTQTLYNLSSQERRVIHLALSNDQDIVTESKGEGAERYLEIRLKSSQ